MKTSNACISAHKNIQSKQARTRSSNHTNAHVHKLNNNNFCQRKTVYYNLILYDDNEIFISVLFQVIFSFALFPKRLQKKTFNWLIRYLTLKEYEFFFLFIILFLFSFPFLLFENYFYSFNEFDKKINRNNDVLLQCYNFFN